MRPKLAITIFLIGLSILIAGCASSSQNNPVPTPTPKATPQDTTNPVLSGTSNPFLFGTNYSNQLQIEIFAYVPAPNGEEVNYSLLMKNNGDTEIRNLLIMLDEIDNSTNQIIYSTTYYGKEPIPPGAEITFSMLGGPHDANLTSMKLHICSYWGNDDEFYNTHSYPVKLPPW
jgi:hypothetical protein